MCSSARNNNEIEERKDELEVKSAQENSEEQCSNESESKEGQEEDLTVIHYKCDNSLSGDQKKKPSESQSMDLTSSADGPEHCVYDPINNEGDEVSIEERLAARNDDTSKSEIGQSETSQSSSTVGANSPCDNQYQPSEGAGNQKSSAGDHAAEESLDFYESFNYWRVPVPQIELEVDLMEGSLAASNSEGMSKMDNNEAGEDEDEVPELISEFFYSNIR